MSVSNMTSLVVTDVKLDLHYDEKTLRMDRREPDHPYKNGKIHLGNIQGGMSKSISVYFEPLICTKGSVINCLLTYEDATGELHTAKMEQKKIEVTCPILTSDSAINVAQLSQLKDVLPCKDIRVYEIQKGFDVKKLATLAREVVEKHDVRHISTLHTRDDKTCEIWYYGKTKVTRSDIVIKVAIYLEPQRMELFAATRSAETLTGLLSEVGRDLKQTLESEIGDRGRVVSIHIKDSVVQRSNLLDMCNVDGTCDVNIVIEDSIIQRSNIAVVDEEARFRQEQKKREDEEKLLFEQNEYICSGQENLELHRLTEEKGKVLESLDPMSIDKNKRKKAAENWMKMAGSAKTIEKQIEYYTKVLDIDPYNAEAWFKKGKALENLGQFEKAKKCFDLSVKVDPDYQDLIGKKYESKASTAGKSSQKKLLIPMLILLLLGSLWLNLLDNSESSDEIIISEKKGVEQTNNDSRLESIVEEHVTQSNFQTDTSEAISNNEENVKSPEIVDTSFSSVSVSDDGIETYTNSIGMEFVLISAGEFMMGSDNGPNTVKPMHEVTIGNNFYLGKYEVTQGQWIAVMGNNPYKFKGDDIPAFAVSWNEVQEFIEKLNEIEGTNRYRLPSEAEWEYACRAGTTTNYSFGDDRLKLSEYAWWAINSGDERPPVHPVGQKKSNPWGLYDMHGNVWEWVQDEWHPSYYDAPTGSSSWEDGSSSFRVIRGGAYNTYYDDCNSAARVNFNPENGMDDMGFRLVMDV